MIVFTVQGEILLSTLMETAMRLRFSMQREDILEHTNAKCHMYML